MSSPQIENGFTKIANEILEVVARTKLSPTQHSIILVVWRSTYGFNKKEHNLSLSYINDATGRDKRNIQRELKRLEDRKIIKQVIVGNQRMISFNKNHNEWIGETTIGNNTIGETANRRNHQSTIGETANHAIGETANQKRKNKEIYKEIYDYYLSLDLIKHRAYTEDMSKAIKKAMKSNKYSVDYCKTLLERHEKVVKLTKESSYPVKARGLTEFFGQKVFNATHLICSEYEEGGKYYEQYIKDEKPKEEKRPPLKLIIRDNY